MATLQDKIRGSLIGGAIGDALGYPVEFIDSYNGIQNRYGENGITRYDKAHYWEGLTEDKAVVSDDTQMTLFTANGLLIAPKLGVAPKYAICQAYLEWMQTQQGKLKGKATCWVRDIPSMSARRAPGNTCLSSLSSIQNGHDPHNNSKGCGGIMRIAPIPLYAAKDNRITIEESDQLAGDAAKITHQHPLGYIPAALEAHVIYRLALDEHTTQESTINYIHEGIEAIKKLYPQHPEDVAVMELLANKAISLATSNEGSDVDNIGKLGEGWVAEENLAIALYCSVKYIDDFEKAIIASVNHKGDSDSIGAVTGNIIGTAIGYDALPDYYLKDLEHHDIILHMADDLYHGKITEFKE